MKVVNIKKVEKQKLGAPLFTGSVSRQSPVRDERADLSIDYVNFPKGIHNKFHKHSNDQVLIVIRGKGFVETKKERLELKVGDVAWAPKGEVHRHGAERGSNFTHISVTRGKTKLTQVEE